MVKLKFIPSFIPEAARNSNIPEESLGEALEAAMREAMDDTTFRKIKRCSYGPRSEDIIGQILGKAMNRKSSSSSSKQDINVGDPVVMEQLVQALLGQVQGQNLAQASGTTPHQAFSRLRPLSRSMRAPSIRRRSSAFNQGIAGNLPTILESSSKRHSGRPKSLSEKAKNAPLVRNILQTLGTNAPHLLETDEESGRPLGRSGRRGSESTALMR